MSRSHQNIVISKLNDYLAWHNRDLILDLGYCHGLTLLWLCKMAENQEKSFYALLRKIIALDDLDTEDADIEKFIAKINWAHNPSDLIPEINQLDIDKILELPKKIAFSAVLHQRQLDELLEKFLKENLLICLSSPSHTVGAYRRGNKFYLYNADYRFPKARCLLNIAEFKKAMLKTLYKGLNVEVKTFSLQINCVVIPSNEISVDAMKILKETVHTTSQAKVTDGYDMNGLHLACENNDIDTVQYFISNFAGINHARVDGQTPLMCAAKAGYVNIINLLLQNNALVNLIDNAGQDALFHAILGNHVESIKILLQHGANPLQGATRKLSSLSFCILRKRWDLCSVLYPYVKNFSGLQAEELSALKEHLPSQAPQTLFSRKVKIKRKLDNSDHLLNKNSKIQKILC